MHVDIHYQCSYRYAQSVGFSPHYFRLFPRLTSGTTVSACEFHTNAGAAVHFRRDLFDNEVARCFYPQKAEELAAQLRLSLQIKERNAYDFLLEPRAFKYPFLLEEKEHLALCKYIATSFDLSKITFWKPQATETTELVVSLNQALHSHIAYERRDEGEAWAPEVTLAQGKGSCRDVAVLCAEILRACGIAARLVSGYIIEDGVKPEDRRAAGAMHAWVEAYLPGAGWLGMDPTNGYLCNHLHIPTAVGICPDDVTPVSGRIAADEIPLGDLTTQLAITVS